MFSTSSARSLLGVLSITPEVGSLLFLENIVQGILSAA